MRVPGARVMARSATVAAAVVTAAVLGSSGCGVSRPSTRASAAVHPPKTITAVHPLKTITATRITRRPGTLALGTRVPSVVLVGQWVFPDAKHGFALASLPDADYAVATTDGGKTWKTDSPALHLHAAQAPLAVLFIEAVNRHSVFAWGGGQVIDASRDGGKTWYRALFGSGGPVAVVRGFTGGLVAFVGSSYGAPIWQYVSKDGGRTWRYQAPVGG